MSTITLLGAIERTIDTLTDASLLLAQAARWADRDRGLSLLSFLGGPMKYWKWHRAKQRLADAIEQIDELRARSVEVAGLPEAAVDFSKLDMVNDLADALPFNVRRVGTPGGPSPLRQQLGVETTVYHQIETARLGVDNLLSEVGLLHARVRNAARTD